MKKTITTNYPPARNRSQLPYLFFLFLLIFTFNTSFAQDPDTTKQSLFKKAISEGMRLISVNPGDTIFNENNTSEFEDFSGRIIRNIAIQQVGFEYSIYEEESKGFSLAKIADKIHRDTRERVIRNHIFLKKGEIMDPQKAGDNERYLRGRDFILDCRILPVETEHPDSVDLIIVTRDVFPLGGTVGGSFPTAPEFSAYDVNLNGRGQRIQFDFLIDADRDPAFGYGLVYRKSSIFGSLADLEVSFSQLNAGRSYGSEYEYTFYSRLTRPLVSPQTRLAGGLELSRNWSVNVKQKEDSLFSNYAYNLVDIWGGYNMGINKNLHDLNRHFLALRFVNNFYTDQPDIELITDKFRNQNLYAYLGEYTFYRQQYYKTRYVLRFGITEDIPYGFSLGITGGYTRILKIERPYAALKFKYSVPRPSGNLYEISLQSGCYFRNGSMEDIIVTGNASYFTRAFSLGNKRLRNLFRAGYSQLFNVVTDDFLRISSNYISGFGSDSLQADKRINLSIESVLYTNWSILGFRLGPFINLEGVIVDCVECPADQSAFIGISSGIRTRNENLTFGTLEFRFTYIPQDEYGDPVFKFKFTQTFRLDNQNFITAPSRVQYN